MELAVGIAGMVIGALITWWASRYYYQKAADDLRREAQRMQVALSIVAHKLERPDAQIEVLRDANGAIIGMRETKQLGGQAVGVNAPGGNKNA